MKYMGGKNRLAHIICSEINSIALNENIENYYEPFVGGGAIIEQVNIKNRYGSDLNNYLIALYKHFQDTDKFEYPNITREQWEHIRKNKEQYPEWLVAWAGFYCSFNARWFNAWGGDYFDKQGTYCNKQLGAYNSILKEIPIIKNINFRNCSYKDINITPHSIIYCDAPYIGTKQYEGAEETFDFDAYYKWLKTIAKDNLVIISEYRMPALDFKSIKYFELNNSLSKSFTDNKELEQTDCIEQLFVVRGGYLVDKYYPDEEDDTYDF